MKLLEKWQKIRPPRWRSGKETTCQCRRYKRHRFNLLAGKIPWSRKWQPTLVLLPGTFHGEKNPAGHSPWSGEESDMTKSVPVLLF